jgi:predicted RecA/RadA family phage recombinase
MATNLVFEGETLSVVVTSPAVPVTGDPVRYGFATGVALTDEGEGGNIATETTVDFGLKVWDLSVTDTVGGGIAVGAVLFLHDGAPTTIDNLNTAGYFFGFAMESIGAGLTATIRVLHVPAPGSGTLGAGTIATANLAAGILSADAPGRALMAANYFTTAQWLSVMTAGLMTEAVLVDAIPADAVTNAVLLQAVLNGAFQADANTRALFAD